MDSDLERALAASLGEEDEEDRQLQEAIRLSKMESSKPSSTPFEDQLRERTAKMKRKAEDEAGSQDSKRRAFDPFENTPPIISKTPAAMHPKVSSKATIKYPDGALRITRTPGRQKTKNCVNLEDVIHKEHLISACVFSFYIAEPELFRHLPLSHSSETVPIYIGRDANMDPLVQEACGQAGIGISEKISNKNLQSITEILRKLYIKQYGKNYNAFYAWSSGSSHSKILALVYPEFLRLVITSCNLMDIDTVLGDNHWYIHDLPKLHSRSEAEPARFESDFLAHLQALSIPDAFLDSIRGMYDYSKVEVHLVTSVPGVCSGIKAERHGLLRLRRVVNDLSLDLENKYTDEVKLEVCAASIGNLSAKWLNGFYDCALGIEKIEVAGERSMVPDIKIFYPSVGDVKKAHPSAQDAASNIGCHTRPWEEAPAAIKDMFHHYESKDAGRLFHQKLIMAYNPKDSAALPFFIYIGSANLSQSAWGALEPDKKKNEATCNTKLVKLTNFECGVVIPGTLLETLLEPGTKDWRSGVVPYVQTAKKYDLSKDRPWNDPRWVQNYQDDWRGAAG